MRSRPSAALRRFHRDRVIAKRIKLAREIAHVDLAEIVPGRLDDQQYYIGCIRPRCRVCHPEKNLPNADRQRADEAWRHLEHRTSTTGSPPPPPVTRPHGSRPCADRLLDGEHESDTDICVARR
jgi:hypothetical protein